MIITGFKGFLCISIILLCGLCVYANEAEVRKSTDFTFAFYQKIFNKNKNMVMCPMAIRYLLGLIYQMSTGETEAELSNILHFDNKVSTLGLHNRMLTNYNKRQQLLFINKFYVNENEPVRENIPGLIDAYKSKIKEIDYSRSPAAVQEINEWISDETDGKIDSLVTNLNLRHQSILLLNSIFFRGFWAKPFEDGNSEEMDFTKPNGEKVSVWMMTDTSGGYFYTQMSDLKASVLEIPYNNTDFKFWIILPDLNSDINAVHRKLTKEVIFNINKSFLRTYIDLVLPKFDITSDIDVKATLDSLGIKKLFTKTEIDIYQNKLIKFNTLNQKLKMTVDLQGTELGTSIGLIGSADNIEYHCTRPFIFLVIRKTYNLKEPVLVGHYVGPE